MTHQVVIDGVRYVPEPPPPPNPGVLDAPMGENDAGAATVREYLICLLETLWNEEEGFSSKRPFGNSGWTMDLHAALVRAGIVEGTFDEEGWLDKWDRKEADKQIALAILSLK